MTITTVSGKLSNSRKVLGLPASDYHHDLDIQSCSLLKAMLESPAHYDYQFTNPRKKSKAMDFGSLVHTLVLEPHKLPLEYAIYPDKRDGRDSAFKAFCKQHETKIVVDEIELQEARFLTERILGRAIRLRPGQPGRPFGRYLEESEREVSIYYDDPETGIQCRVRFDALHPEAAFDLKKSAEVTLTPWLRAGIRLHYDLQAHMYSLAEMLFSDRRKPLPFVFVAGELARPYSVSVFTAGESFLREGAIKYARAMGSIAACRQVHHWPDQSEDAVLELEPWMANAADEPGWRTHLAQQASGVAVD